MRIQRQRDFDLIQRHPKPDMGRTGVTASQSMSVILKIPAFTLQTTVIHPQPVGALKVVKIFLRTH
jgi:hypothetical protein